MEMHEMHTHMRAHKGTRAPTHARTHTHAHARGRRQTRARTHTNAFTSHRDARTHTQPCTRTRSLHPHARARTDARTNVPGNEHEIRVCTTASADAFIYPLMQMKSEMNAMRCVRACGQACGCVRERAQARGARVDPWVVHATTARVQRGIQPRTPRVSEPPGPPEYPQCLLRPLGTPRVPLEYPSSTPRVSYGSP
jgi:hypothetical protein